MNHLNELFSYYRSNNAHTSTPFKNIFILIQSYKPIQCPFYTAFW